MLIIVFVVAAIAFAGYLLLQHPKFGGKPDGKQMELMQQSPNYRNGAFQNVSLTPSLAEDATISGMFKDYFSAKNKRPSGKIPSKKTNIHDMKQNENVLIWFGHSSYFMQVGGKRILVDPVFSGHASPFSFMIKSFQGTDIYSEEDIPEIDYLFITHDHWDHLDYKTIKQLKPKIKKVITGLGVGSHFERWGFDRDRIIERDWNQEIHLDDNFKVFTATSRHFSGRGLKRNKTLWSSFVLFAGEYKIYIGGDSGYDSHFAEIGRKYGDFDLVILENGQYNKIWKYIHLMPDEVLKAAKDLNAKKLFPVHSGKFALANHAWDEPLRKITSLNTNAALSLITPMIGEKVRLNDDDQKFTKWWENVH